MARHRRGSVTYEDLLDIAAKMFDVKGYHQTTMQDIGNAAGLTKGGLYHHLLSKEATLFAINERFMMEGLAEIKGVVGDDQLPVSRRLERLVITIAAQHDKHDSDLRIALKEFDSVGTDYRDRLISLRNDYEAVVRELVETGIRQRVIHSSDPDLVVKFIFGSVNWMSMWYRVGGRYSAADVGQQFADMIIRALCTTGSSSHADGGAPHNNSSLAPAGTKQGEL